MSCADFGLSPGLRIPYIRKIQSTSGWQWAELNGGMRIPLNWEDEVKETYVFLDAGLMYRALGVLVSGSLNLCGDLQRC